VKTRALLLRVFGAILAYGCLAAFIGVVGVQLYRWLREGQWTSIGVSDGMLALLHQCGVKDGGAGRLARLAHWLATPDDWLGWHKILAAIPASLGLFALSVIGNFAFVYGGDRLNDDESTGDA